MINQQLQEIKNTAQKITKSLAVYSLVPASKITLAHEKGIMSTFVKAVDVSGHNRMLPEGFNERGAQQSRV